MSAVDGGETYDLVGIGIGPSNLSLAALLAPFPGVRTRFFDRARELKWHPGLLFPEAEIQVSHLKDLVTPADPTSRFSFLAFLHSRKRLYRFMHAEFPRIRRLEFDQYLHWVASQLPELCFGRPVDAVTWDGGLAVHAGGERIRARHLALGSGLSPRVPAFARPYLGETVFHSSDFLLKRFQPAGRRVMVVGGGQSGAELVSKLLADASALPRELYWVSRRPSFLPLDESPFANEWFTPTYSQHFFRLPGPVRERLVAEQALASDGISTGLLKTLCQRLYELDFLQAAPCARHLWPARDLTALAPHGDGWRVAVRDLIAERSAEVGVDCLILATGYTWAIPAYLEPILDRVELENGCFRFQEDYSIVWEGSPGHQIYAMNAARIARGVADPNLSLLAWRSSKIANSLLGRQVYEVDEAAALVGWGGPQADGSPVDTPLAAFEAAAAGQPWGEL
ncbi:MAG TPA: SidA/IucD/PvdA family monooxygenase [Thermoanaerobaculia bacterium]|nr:SidA/IucD/PvdA family monooxygenase [Thermoanaerobaculia bacterium]